jgi:peptidoglycan-associated lipoprotein
MKETAIRTGAFSAFALIFALTACGTTKTAKKIEPTTTISASTAPVSGEGGEVAGSSTTAPSDEGEPSVREAELAPVKNLETVNFEYDSAKLGSAALAILAQNAAWLKEHEDSTVQVAGHCDQRGTESYNLALGQRRAKAVRDYYRTLGVKGKRIATISYGKDQPLCKEETEACWQKNRRAETLVAAPRTDAAAPKPDDQATTP